MTLWTVFVEQVYVFDLGEAGRPLAMLHTLRTVSMEPPAASAQEVVPAPVRIALAIGSAGLEVTVTGPDGGMESRVVTNDHMAAELGAALEGVPTDTAVVIAAQSDVPYARVVAVIDALRAAGFSRFALNAHR